MLNQLVAELNLSYRSAIKITPLIKVDFDFFIIKNN